MEIVCRKCFETDLLREDLDSIILEYINSMEEEQRASDFVYERRISICEECEALINGLCKYCGCFVLARAAKKNLSCPNPGNNKW